jgi:hypothetical protein
MFFTVTMPGSPPGALYLQPVVEHAHLDGRAGDAVITVGDGLDDDLAPGKVGVLGLLGHL